MTVVIDIGCARYGNDYSVERLLDEFAPDVLYGFDPNQGADEYPWQAAPPSGGYEPTVSIEKKAAWLYDGEIGFRSDTLNSWVTELRGAQQVPCFDIATFIDSLDDPDIVLKIDAEGSEYDLLRHLIARGMDKKIRLAWIEWHEPDRGRAKIEEEWDGEMVEWRW